MTTLRKVIYRTALAALTLSLFIVLSQRNAKADGFDKKTTMTFSESFEVPGHILPAGTYIFRLHYNNYNRNIVEIWSEDSHTLLATILAISNSRAQIPGKPIISFTEAPSGQPQAIKAWFYAGERYGLEFVYPKKRAIELAALSKEPVPFVTEEATPEVMKTQPIMSMTPEQKEQPVPESAPPVAETPAPEPAPTVAASTATAPAPVTAPETLPKTGSDLTLIALLGMASLGAAASLKRSVN